MKLSKFTKQIIAIVMCLALVFVGNYFVPSSIDAEDITMSDLPDGAWTQLGGKFYGYAGLWGGSGSSGKAGVNSTNTAVKAQKAGGQWSSAWSMQIALKLPELTSAVQGGAEYTITWNIKASSNDGNLLTTTNNTDAQKIPLTGSEQTLTGKIAYVNDLNSAGWVVGMGWIGNGVSIDFSNPVVKDSQGNTVYPAQEPSSSETVSTTEPEPTSAGYNMHALVADQWDTLGPNGIKATMGSGNNSSAQVGYDYAEQKAKFTQVSGGNWYQWGSQVALVRPDLKDEVYAGDTYYITWHIHTENGVSGNEIWTSDSNGEGHNIDFSSGDLTLQGTLKYNSDLDAAFWSIGTMWIPEGVSVIFDEPTVSTEEPTTTTEAPTTTTEEPSTPAGYNMHPLVADQWDTLGPNGIKATMGSGNQSSAQVGYDYAEQKAKFTQVSGGNWYQWGSQVALVRPDLKDEVYAGDTYYITWHIHTENGVSGNEIWTSDSSGEGHNIDFSSGDLTLYGTLKYNSDLDAAFWAIGTMWIPEGVSVIFDEPTVSTTPPETTTQAPTTTEEPTTQPGTPCEYGDEDFYYAEQDGWSYKVVDANQDSKYENGGANENFILHHNSYLAENDNWVTVNSPVTDVTPGRPIVGSISLTSTESMTADKVYATVYWYNDSTGQYGWLAEAPSQPITAGTKATFDFSFTAPDQGKVVYRIATQYTPVASFTYEYSNTQIDPGTACDLTAGFHFADATHSTGWQYSLDGRATDSRYVGGTDLASTMQIYYSPYVASDDVTCSVGTPVLAVPSGENFSGSMSVTCSKNIGSSGQGLVSASVYWYNENTGQYGWYANANEGATNLVAGQKKTFTFDYTAPETGHVFYVISSKYTPIATLEYEYEGAYDVSQYKSGQTYTYPEKDGKVFAGWYTDDTYTTPYTETTGYAYAKFVDEDVLTVKFQEKTPDKDAVRFLSTIDSSLDYQELGFKFTGHYGTKTITEKTKTVNTVYNKILADGQTTLPTVFSPDSAHFFTYTVRNIDSSVTPLDFTVTPFYVTADGTTVEGRTGEYPQS